MRSSAREIFAWRGAIQALQERFDFVDRVERLRLLDGALGAFTALNRESEEALEAFSFPSFRDGRLDGETILKVCLHGASLGELILCTQPLPDALESGWTFLPTPPIAIAASETMPVGTPPSTESLAAWMLSVVDPVAQAKARAAAAWFCLQQLRDASSSGAEIWLEKLQTRGLRVSYPPAELSLDAGRGDYERAASRVEREIILELFNSKDHPDGWSPVGLAERLGASDVEITVACEHLNAHGVLLFGEQQLRLSPAVCYLGHLDMIAV